MSYKKKARIYKGNKIITILEDACCFKLVMEDNIYKSIDEDSSIWNVEDGQVIVVEDITCCPFCGSKLK